MNVSATSLRIAVLGTCLALVGCGRLGYVPLDELDAASLDAGSLDAASLDAGPLDAAALLDTIPTDTAASDGGAPSTDGGADISCGDGIVEEFEECDDGNGDVGDGCEPTCTTTRGFVCVEEPSRCTTACGDGALASGEECDDGNVVAGDGCGASCVLEASFACNRGQAPYFAFRRGRSDCVETLAASLADGTLFHTDDATVRLRHVAGAYRYDTGRWVAVGRTTAWIEGGGGPLVEGPTTFVPPGTRDPADELTRAAAIAYAARAGPRDLSATDARTIALSVWDGACSDNTDEMTVWRVDRLSRCEPRPPGLVSWLPLDDSFLDAVAARPALPAPASHGFVQGVNGWALQLAASTAMDTSALGSGSYTVALWFAWADRTTPPPRMQNVLSVPFAGAIAHLDTASTFSLLVSWDRTVTITGLDVAVPHHLAVAVTATPTRMATVHVDGVLIDTITSDSIPSPVGAMLRLYAGSEIDDLRIYDRPLGSAEISALATR